MYINPNDGEKNEDLLVWITEPGEEYYLHMYYWREVPFSFKLDATTEAIDVTVRKSVKKKDERCNPTEDYDYISS